MCYSVITFTYIVDSHIQFICPQIGTGFKDDQLEQHTDFFKDHLLEGPKPYFRYNEGTQPDQWFDSVQVNSSV